MLDSLDALRDLQREGYVRAVSTRNLSPDAQWLAEQCGLAEAIGSNGADGSLLWRPGSRANRKGGVVPPLYTQEDYDASLRIPSKRLPTILSSPLAGGLLTDRYLHRPSPAQLSNISERERERHLRIVQDYAMRRHSESTDEPESSLAEEAAWSEYQTALELIHRISRGYVGADAASLSLRWLLQQQRPHSPTAGGQQGLDHSSASPLRNIPSIAGLVVATQFYDPNQEDDVQKQIARRIKALRGVFTFQLPSEEMEQLNDLSGWRTTLKSSDATKDRSSEKLRIR